MTFWRRKHAPTRVKDEHFVPSRGLSLREYARAGDLQGAHHLVRYEWLLEVLATGERRVLDLGCGAGYGTFLIAERFPGSRVLGVDADGDAVRGARRSYRRDNLEYVEGDAMLWREPRMDGEFDVIVAFDSLEHVPHRELMLEQVVRHLAPGGAVYLSTPCGAPDNDLTPGWTAHRIEYGAASLFDFLSRYFRSLTRPEDADFPALRVFGDLRANGIDYLLRCNPVICRDPIRVPNPYLSE